MQSPVTRSTHCSPSRGITVHDRWNTHHTLPGVADGAHWEAEKWSIATRAAAEIANKKAKKSSQRIPAGVSAYSFRHTRISELLQR
jgi:hypothetical protein